MKKILVIAGPTATGKSAYAVQCAKLFNGEIINGDSQQVYRQLNIGTAKITETDQQGIPHHLLDILDYDQPYNVADFQKDARKIIDQITSRQHLPILCGGSGYYLKAVLYDYEFLPETASTSSFEQLSDQQCYDRLVLIDPSSAAKTHPNNRKRVLRALTMSLTGPLKSEREAIQTHAPIFDVFVVVLNLEREILHQRIEKRVASMMDQGLAEEVKDYFSTKEAQSFQSFLGIGYKEFIEVLNGTAEQKTAQEAIVIHTRQFAKRQLTWFRHQFTAKWVDASDTKALALCQDEISLWLKKENL